MHHTKTYLAEFYSVKETNKYLKYYFKNIKNDSNEIIKQFVWVKFNDLSHIVSNLKPGDLVLFDAIKIDQNGYRNNFKLIKPHNIRMYKND